MYTLIGPKKIISNMQKRTMNYKSVFFLRRVFLWIVWVRLPLSSHFPAKVSYLDPCNMCKNKSQSLKCDYGGSPGVIAQFGRASDLHSEGRGFESHFLHIFENNTLTFNWWNWYTLGTMRPLLG